MKKLGKLVSMMILVGILVGCSNSSQSETSATDSKKNTGENQLEQIKSRGKLVITTSPDFPPAEFYIVKDGKKEVVGNDIALSQAIADEIGVKLEIKATDFSSVLANIQTGSVDFGISSFVGTDERKEVMDFSDGYFQESSDGFQGIMMTKENAKKYKTLDELKKAKLTVGAHSGSIQYELAKTITDENKVKHYGTTDATILALNSGDVDALTVSSSSVEPMLDSFPDLTILPQDSFDLDKEGKYSLNVIGFPKQHNNTELIEIVNRVIKENKDNGNIAKWRDEYTKLSAEAVE
ncbi:transporter substrate-binding domain-containing protein [Vagococcus bubulae]|uniref:Amino acid ABC transporter substrate-binding protein n=1 Tax=Vagococcus bubulae TaxID=1977868 RepID=A0A429ZPK7_9ENTE|nr:transporter substrate-binding domain-containing protein [Vagococcus bubulae]RST95615.1 amino acid ABC transporter substrate-binding protein [Vagococcus bubulae]